MKRGVKRGRDDDERGTGDARAAQLSDIALFVIDDLASHHSLLRRHLSKSDVSCVRFTCRLAWQSCFEWTMHKGNMLRVALDDGHVPFARWSLQVGALVYPEDCYLIGELGDGDVIDLVVQQLPQAIGPIAEGCARRGHAHVLTGLLRRGTAEGLTRESVQRALARNGDVDLALSVDTDPAWLRAYYLHDVLRSGRREFVEWVLGGTPCPGYVRAASCAAFSGSLDLLRWGVEEEGWTLYPDVLENGARSGSLEVVGWLIARGCQVLSGAGRVAAQMGDSAMLTLLLDAGCVMDERHVYAAAENGHMDLLQLLLRRGCPHEEEEVARSACQAPTVSVLRWWIESGRAWNPAACAEVSTRHVGCVGAASLVAEVANEMHWRFVSHALQRRDLDGLRCYVRVGGGRCRLSADDVQRLISASQYALLDYVLVKEWETFVPLFDPQVLQVLQENGGREKKCSGELGRFLLSLVRCLETAWERREVGGSNGE